MNRAASVAPTSGAAPRERLFLCGRALHRSEDVMNTFRKNNHPKSVMFVVSYDDARTAYLWIDNAGGAIDDRAVGSTARTQQEQGILPEGNITSIKRVR
jgi:hypothetical protein